VWRLHGAPLKILSDRDVRFQSQFWLELMRLMGTKVAMSTSYHPQSNGQAENTNKTMEQILRAFVDPRQSDWDLFLATAEYAVNDSVHKSSGKTPFEVIYGTHPSSQLDLYLGTSMTIPDGHRGGNQLVTRWAESLEQVKRNLFQAQENQKTNYDKHHQPLVYEVGQRVLLNMRSLTAPTHRGVKFKLRAPWQGPFTISEVLTGDDGQSVAYRLQLPMQWKCHNTFSVDKLRPYLSSQIFQDRKEIPPPTQLIEGEEEFVVDRILADRVVKRRKGRRTISETEYLVSWKGYGEAHHEWLPERALNTQYPLEQLVAYQQTRKVNRGVLSSMITQYEEEDRLTHRIDDRGSLIPLTKDNRTLKVLVLFSGTGSVEKAVALRYPNAEIINLDIDPKWNPIHVCDIEQWTKKGEGTMHDYPPGYFDLIWASPECKMYSFARTTGPKRDLEGADRRVSHTLKVIEYLKPKYYIIENPRGYLYKRDIMQGNLLGTPLPSNLNLVSYCMYGTSYKKPTHIWTNLKLCTPLSFCSIKTPCDNVQKHGIHLVTAQSGPSKNGTPGSGSAAAVYPIPQKLLDELLSAIPNSEKEVLSLIFCMIEFIN